MTYVESQILIVSVKFQLGLHSFYLVNRILKPVVSDKLLLLSILDAVVRIQA